MPAVCPRCQRASPAGSAYCWFDGGSLLTAHDGVQRLAQAFVFPSGKRCQTLEDFAQACQDEWPAARDLLSKDSFRQFFISMGRHDLVRLAQEVMQHPNTDIQLSRFVDGLPVVRVNVPKLDFQPRRFTLGRLPAGDHREIELVLVNQGKGVLQGTVTINEGGDWLSFPDSTEKDRLRVQTPREERVRIAIDTAKLKSAQNYVGQLMVVTSGGVAEVPVRFELVAKPFPKAPFQGVRTPRELAEKMRTHPKHAGPMLEAGDIERWFAINNWEYPVQGPVAKGVAGVQQFFEAMGLSRPPKLQLSQKELRFSTHYPDTVRFQVAMQTSSRKWVYGQVSSDRPWLKVLTPKIIGPQHANILLEADPTLITDFPPEKCRVVVKGNGGQKLDFGVTLDVQNLPRPMEPEFWRPMLVFAILFVLLRLLLIPVVDLHARAAIAEAATSLDWQPNRSLLSAAGWLQLPWVSLLAGFDAAIPLELFTQTNNHPGVETALRARDFRHYFIAAFVRDVVLWTWWLGPALTMLALAKHAELAGRALFLVRNTPFALAAGSVAGILLAATLACVFLTVEIAPHIVWEVIFGPTASVGFLPVWLFVATTAWFVIGACVGIVVAVAPPLRRAIVPAPQALLAALCRLCRMHRLESLIAPNAG